MPEGRLKRHVDDVTTLGPFIQIEAIDRDGTIGPEELRRRCRESLDLFEVREEDLVSESYGDLARTAAR